MKLKASSSFKRTSVRSESNNDSNTEEENKNEINVFEDISSFTQKKRCKTKEYEESDSEKLILPVKKVNFGSSENLNKTTNTISRL